MQGRRDQVPWGIGLGLPMVRFSSLRMTSHPICPKFILNETPLFANFTPLLNLIVKSLPSSLGCY